MMKRIFAMMMAVMLLSCTYAFAQEIGNPLSDEQIKTVTSYKIFVGDENGDLMLDENITRAQMCKVLYAARGMNVSNVSSEAVFSDVAPEHWANGYISAAQSEKLIEGDGNGLFNPDDNVLMQDAVKMIICALGYEELAQARGGYPTGYIVTASQCGLTKNIPFRIDDYAKRSDIVKFICNALDIPVMQKVEYEDKVEYIMMNGENGKTLMTFRTMLEESTYYDGLLPLLTRDKEDVEADFDLSDATVNARGNQETYSFDYDEGDISSKHMIFYNNVFVEYQYDFEKAETAYSFAKELRADMEKIFGEKTTYPGMTMTYGDYFDNIEDASVLKSGYKYFEDWTLAGVEAQMKHHKNWTPYLDDEQQIKKITGGKEYGRIDVRLVLDVISETMATVSVKCSVLP